MIETNLRVKMYLMRREDVKKHLESISGWKQVADTIEKNYKFRNFRQAIEFVNRIADVADAEDHHPDILLWNWNNVKLTLTTHTLNGLSEKDFEVAAKIDKIQFRKIRFEEQ
ncbi:MAG: 4a-hydroxytetrahydrobiopterin dehydratase [Thermoproteota archaeon]|nr:4a-hydroxytetrahydrobiopterin dehydratase [Thermoproteota archaeon]